MSISTKINSVIQRVRNDGVKGTLHWLHGRIQSQYLERKYGIHTNDIVFLNKLGLDHPERREYAPVTFNDFSTLLQNLDIGAGKDVFVDFGAGMGRALVLAATYNFRQVIGVELSSELATIATRNIERASPKLRCKDVVIFTQDATEYDLPVDANVIFFNNPFSGTILERVLSNIKKSLLRSPRNITLICNLPAECAFEKQMRQQDWHFCRRNYRWAEIEKV